MKFLFPGLCWAVITGGLLLACTKKPKPQAPPEAPKGEAYEEDLPMVDPNDAILSFGEDPPPAGPIYFDYDSFTLKDRETVAALALHMRHNARVVTLAGHASHEGADDYNLHLGARRAQAVRAWLEAAGIPEHRITWISYGEEKPAETPELSRRVVFTLEDPK